MYSENVRTEANGMKIVTDYLEFRTGNRPIPITEKNQQKLIGDIIVATNRGTTSVEVKIEERYTGNLFVEVWSNREWGGLGWLFTSQAQSIVFYFRDADTLVGLSLPALKHWLLNQHDGKLDSYKQVRVKQSGRNDTHGVCVPIAHLQAAQVAGLWIVNPKQKLDEAADGRAA